jgi:GNAT superfamily N-acetyltransferase
MTGEGGGREPVTIRRATPGDVDRLADLCGQLGYPLSREQVRLRLTEIAQEPGNEVHVAVGSGEFVVGWIQLYVRQLLMVERHVEMGGLVVDEAYRGQGVGRMLVDWAETWARDHGCDTIYLRSNVQREAAHRFYERMGYQLTKTQRAYWKSLTGQDDAAGGWAQQPETGVSPGTTARR